MKDLFTIAATLFFFSASSGFGGFVAVANMLMGNSLGSYLSELVSFDSLTVTQMDDILNIADNTTSSDRFDMFETEESKDELRSYLYAEVSASNMEEYTAEMIASITSLGALYPTEQLDLVGFEGPAESNYDGNGNLESLARIQPDERPTNINNNIYNGIWGVTKGEREYALLTSSWGFEIIDVTNPRNPFKVQGVIMEGGHVWRDVATHTAPDGKVYAYVAAQDLDNRPSNLFVFDLSELSGDIDTPNGVNSNPIEPGVNGYLDRGQSGLGHTVNVAGGFLFLNAANQNRGCVVFDLSNPMNPNQIFSHRGNGKQCHDSSLWENVNVNGQLKSLWIVSEGSGMVETIMDFTDVKTTLQKPQEVLSTTPLQNGMYAHSNALSADKRFLFQFDENKKGGDIYVYDISNVFQPRIINRFQYSEEDTSNAIPHNGHIRGGYLHVAYYEAGLRTFDISNPYEILEVGKIETFRDPQQTGTNVRQIQGNSRGAWNTYVGLSSGNILVSDMFYGLFIVKANSPYPEPNAPTLSAVRNANNGVTLTWNAVPNARAYSVERRIGGQSFVVVAEFLTTTSYFDNSVRDTNASYKVKAVNGEGTGVSATVESVVLTASPTKAPTNQPTPRPSPLPTPNPTSPPSRAPTPQPSPNPTPLPENSPIPVPTTAAPTRNVRYSGAFGCLRDFSQSNQCLPPVFDKERAVNCCQGQGETLECDRPDCSLATSFFDATAICENKGMRLCSTQELESRVCCSKGCNFDGRVGWTTDICAPQTPAPTPPPPTPPPTPQPTGGADELPGTPYPTFEATGSLQSMAEPL